MVSSWACFLLYFLFQRQVPQTFPLSPARNLGVILDTSFSNSGTTSNLSSDPNLHKSSFIYLRCILRVGPFHSAGVQCLESNRGLSKLDSRLLVQQSNTHIPPSSDLASRPVQHPAQLFAKTTALVCSVVSAPCGRAVRSAGATVLGHRVIFFCLISTCWDGSGSAAPRSSDNNEHFITTVGYSEVILGLQAP